MNTKEMYSEAYKVLQYNDLGEWTRPAPDLYPHQWLWDSCFIAIGLAHEDPKRAMAEIESLMRGQWSNGMVPNMIFSESNSHHKRPEFWNSRISPHAPDKYDTSGITQPPMIAEAVQRIGTQLSEDERKEFYKRIYPKLLAYHEWLYRERDPHAKGMVLLVHPWETGMDNTPPWIEEMQQHHMPLWIKAVELLRIDRIIEKFRRDTRQVSPEERASTIQSLILYSIVRRLRRKAYNTERILLRSHFLVEDVFFNSILIRANSILREIADEIHEEIPRQLDHAMNQATKCIEELWDEESGVYRARNFITRNSSKEVTVASLAPLYSGAITKKRAKQLCNLLHDSNYFNANFPLPSVALSSPYFNHRRYWQGPTWINTNWLIIDGLKRYGFEQEAERLRQKSLQLISKSGFHEYFSPIDGYGAGIQPFSWTAALTMDMIKAQPISEPFARQPKTKPKSTSN